jgi:hypothetical protein
LMWQAQCTHFFFHIHIMMLREPDSEKFHGWPNEC